MTPRGGFDLFTENHAAISGKPLQVPQAEEERLQAEVPLMDRPQIHSRFSCTHLTCVAPIARHQIRAIFEILRNAEDEILIESRCDDQDAIHDHHRAIEQVYNKLKHGVCLMELADCSDPAWIEVLTMLRRIYQRGESDFRTIKNGILNAKEFIVEIDNLRRQLAETDRKIVDALTPLAASSQ